MTSARRRSTTSVTSFERGTGPTTPCSRSSATSRPMKRSVSSPSISATLPRQLTARGKVAEILGDETLRFIGREVADDREHGVVGPVPRSKEVTDVVERRRAQVIHRSDRRPVIRVVGIVSELQQTLERRAVRNVVVALPPLLLDHLSLNVEFLLGQRREKKTHAIRFQPESEGQVVRWERLEIVGAVEERRAVQHAAHRLHVAEVLVVADVLRSGEEHVLEQM